MRFVCDDVTNTPNDLSPDMVISLHACDIATDIVINRATKLRAKVILSTPCCHSYLNNRISASSLEFVTSHPLLRGKLCEAMTDALRIARMEAMGYRACALELTDPENTPKNTLLRAIRDEGISKSELLAKSARYEELLTFVLGDKKDNYLKEIK